MRVDHILGLSWPQDVFAVEHTVVLWENLGLHSSLEARYT